MKHLLDLKNVSFEIKSGFRKILTHVNLSIDEEEFVVLLGSNGSGKSTLIRIIQGIFRPTSGTVSFVGRDQTKISLQKLSKEIVSLTQDMSMTTFSHLTVFENCLMARLRYEMTSLKVKSEDEKKFFKEYLSSFHRSLPNHLDTPVSNLSGGERQLLSLSLCLLHPPKLLLLDEHTSALDPKASELVMEKTKEMITLHKITTIMTTHKIDQAMKFGSRLLVMKEGSIIKDMKNKEKKSLKEKDILSFYS